MLTVNYAWLHAIASAMIDDWGRAAVMTSNAGNLSVAVTVSLINYETQHIDGKLIQRGDRRALIAADPGVPLPDTAVHRLVIDGVPFHFIDVKQVGPNGAAVFFDCQVRA